MKKQIIRRVLSFICTLALLFSISSVGFAADSSSDVPYAIAGWSYNDVSDYIQKSTNTVSTLINNSNVTYYFGEHYVVTFDSGNYYLTIFDDNCVDVSINNVPIRYRSVPVPAATNSDYLVEYTHEYDVGGLAISVATSLIGAAIGGYVTSAILETLISTIAGNLAGTFITGYFDLSYYLTINFKKEKPVIVKPGFPTVMGFTSYTTTYAGPSNNKQLHLLVDAENSWEETYYS